jgi:septum formation topological specificity factor MinE
MVREQILAVIARHVTTHTAQVRVRMDRGRRTSTLRIGIDIQHFDTAHRDLPSPAATSGQ